MNSMAYSDTELRSMLQTVLMGVCTRCDFVHGEALRPSGNSCLVQSGASYAGSTGASDFHRASMNFYFPPNVSLAGRVWKSGCTEVHEDVSILPSTIFLRAELAQQTELRTALAMPLCKDSRVLAVCIFYSRYVIPTTGQLEARCLAFANEVLASTCSRLRMDPSLRFVSGDPSNVEIPSSKGATSRAWQRCMQSLDVPPDDRTEEQLEHITKYSKGVQFFKYITNQQRIDLCKTMTYTTLLKNQLMMQGGEGSEVEPPSNVWHVVVSGRVDMCVRTNAEGNTYRMCGFKEGDTFAASYMKMFRTQPCISTHIEASSDATCIVITIPDEYKEEFRTCTRPLWYEELAQFFHMSINEAADSLGMCMSAIKKICRRHGISRWPHRKLASVNKTVAMLQSKIATATDEAARAALRSEAVNVLTMKLRLTINPAYLVRDEAVLLPAMGNVANVAVPSFGMPGGGAGAMGGPFPGGGGRSGFDEGESMAFQAGRGGDVGGVDRGFGMMQPRSTFLARAEAEAAAAANAASVLHNVSLHNIARAGGRDSMGAVIGYPGIGKGEMRMGMGMGMGMGDPLMQQRIMFQNQQQHQQQHQQQQTQQRPPAGGGGGLRRKGDDEAGSAFESPEEGPRGTEVPTPQGNAQQRASNGNGIGPGGGGSAQGGRVGLASLYGMQGHGGQLGQLAVYPQGSMGQQLQGWQGGQLGADLLQPRSMGFGGYGLGGGLQGMPGGGPMPQAQQAAAAQQQQQQQQQQAGVNKASQQQAQASPGGAVPPGEQGVRQQQGGDGGDGEPEGKRARLT